MRQGVAFRDAYREAARSAANGEHAVQQGVASVAQAALAQRTATGTAGNLGLDERRGLVATERRRVEAAGERAAAALARAHGTAGSGVP